MNTAEEIIEQMKFYESDRSNFETYWQSCADYAMPQSNQITKTRSSGTPSGDLFDTTAEDSNIQMAAGLYSYMFPTDSKAFTLRVEDPDISEIDEVKQWLDRTTSIIHEYLVASNFRQAFFEFLKSLGCYGTADMYVDKGKKSVLNFVNNHMAMVYISCDSEWMVDTVFLKVSWTARQAVQEFGDEAGPEVLEASKDPKKKHDKFEFIHAIYPRETEGADPLKMPVASVWVNRQEKLKVSEGGHPEMPHMVTRFDRDPLEDFGRSPTMKMLPDIKMINEMKRVRIKSWDKMCDPPAILPDDGSIWPLSTQPGGVVFKTPGSEGPEYWEFKGNLQGMEEAITAVRTDIRNGYFLDLFDALIDRQNMTATEVIARVEQRMRLLTPIIGRLQSEFFNPLINRIIGILTRAGKLPPMPAALSEKDFKVEYLGRLALALKTLDSEGFVKTMADLLPLAEAGITDWLDNFDIDEITRNMGRNNGMPSTWIKAMKAVKKERFDRQQAQAQQALMENAKDLSGAVKNLSVKPEEGSIAEGAINAA